MNIFLENNTRFAKLCLNGLPSGYKSAESSILSLHDAEIDSKDEIISYLKSLYKISGFSGSLHSTTHIAMTYSALASLIICGDDLNWINKSAITNHLSTLQNEDGSFSCYKGGESDMRFVYCACAISKLLDDYSGINQDKCISYIINSKCYDHGFGQGPNQESHGGSTYCALASLSILEKLNLINKDKTIQFLLNLQTDGFSGRTNKPADVCYTFWVGASIHILDPCAIDLVDTELLFRFLERAKFKGGGFGKFENSLPDLLHSYMGLAGFGIFHGNVKKVEVLLNIREDIMKDLTF